MGPRVACFQSLAIERFGVRFAAEPRAMLPQHGSDLNIGVGIAKCQRRSILVFGLLKSPFISQQFGQAPLCLLILCSNAQPILRFSLLRSALFDE